VGPSFYLFLSHGQDILIIVKRSSARRAGRSQYCCFLLVFLLLFPTPLLAVNCNQNNLDIAKILPLSSSYPRNEAHTAKTAGSIFFLPLFPLPHDQVARIVPLSTRILCLGISSEIVRRMIIAKDVMGKRVPQEKEPRQSAQKYKSLDFKGDLERGER
jgi:hypothetical protein